VLNTVGTKQKKSPKKYLRKKHLHLIGCGREEAVAGGREADIVDLRLAGREGGEAAAACRRGRHHHRPVSCEAGGREGLDAGGGVHPQVPHLQRKKATQHVLVNRKLYEGSAFFGNADFVLDPDLIRSVDYNLNTKIEGRNSLPKRKKEENFKF